MKSQEKLSLLSELLDIERKQDFQLYREKVLLKSLKERVEEGVCWYPVDLKRLYVGTGEKIIVEIKRTDDKEGKRPNALQAGSLVTVFGMNADREAGQAGGVVYSLRKGSMKIVLSSDEIPAWLQDSRIGVNLDFDDKTYREMQAAIKQVASAKKDRLAELREILMGGHEPAFGEWEYTFRHPLLNSSQEKAVQKVLEAKDVALIHGPPGTGKTTTLVHAIQEVLQREHQVLVCAPSNTATDLLTIRCAEMGLNPVRLGNPARVDESLQLHTLDSTIARHEDYGALKKLRVESEQLYRKASKYKRRMDRDQYQRKREVLREARDLKRYAETLEDYIIGQVMDRSQVVCATLSGAGHKLLLKRKFNTVFIDEAGQALGPSCWIAISRANRVIFAGDHQQLPPTVKSFEAEKRGLGKTLFEELIQNPRTSSMLTVQYRMHQQIMEFSSRKFYHGKLEAAHEVAYRSLPYDPVALEFVDTAGCGFEERKDSSSLSTFNPEEAMLVLKHLAITLKKMQVEMPEVFEQELPDAEDVFDPGQLPISIGLIAPYKAQIQRLQRGFLDSPMLADFEPYVSINTVDGFQGQERDVIYISLTRSNPKGEIGFLKNIRRMNVALTRARKKLVVVGDSATLGSHPFYADFLSYVENEGTYRTGWELMD